MFPGSALHVGHTLGLGSWSFEPSVIIGAMLVLGLYIYRTSRILDEVSDWRIVAFLAGWLSMFLALVSPLDGASDRLLAMHMLQHVLLTTVGPPLVLLGLNAAILRPVLGWPRFAPLLKVAATPAITGTLFIVNMWFWHVPPVYETAVKELPVHIAMHFAFMGTGLLFWWPVILPLPHLHRVSEGARLLYLFVTGFPMELQALLLLSSGSVIYGYYDQANPLWGLGPMEDQQIAALIMGAIGSLASFMGITWLFFRYLDREGTEGSPRSESVDVA